MKTFLLTFFILLDISVGCSEMLKTVKEMSKLERSDMLLRLSTKPGNGKLIDMLIEEGLDYSARDESGYTLIHRIKKPGILNKLLLTQGGFALLNDCKNINQDTPLSDALEYKELAKSRLLLSFKAKIYLADIVGNLPIHIAIENNIFDNQIIRGLRKPLKKFETINRANAEGETPLSMAIMNDRLDIALPLIKSKKINLDAQDIYGNTLAHRCILKGKLKGLKLLLQYGASLDITNSQRLTPLQMAERTLDEQYKRVVEKEI